MRRIIRRNKVALKRVDFLLGGCLEKVYWGEYRVKANLIRRQLAPVRFLCGSGQPWSTDFWFLPYTAGVRFPALVAIRVLLISFLFAADKSSVPVVRWSQDAPNCTLRAGNDGRTYYGISNSDFEVILAVDRQELEKIPHRATPMLGVLLTFHYKGGGELDVHQKRFTLEFAKHFQVVKTSLDPDDMLHQLQEDVDDLTDDVERHQVRNHPEQKVQKEAELQSRLKDYTETMDFISTHALRPAVLNLANPTVSGWVFFAVKDRWIGPWRKPEQFVLRLPVANRIVEFPFSLPPPTGGLELRRRPAVQP